MAFAEILSLQRALNEFGVQPRLVEDGLWGPKTESAALFAQEEMERMKKLEPAQMGLGLGLFALGVILYRNRKCGSDRDTERIGQMQPAAAAAAQRVLCRLKKQGINVTVTETLRSHARQAQLLAQGNGVTNAAPGRSYHQYGLAIDIVPLDSKGQPTWTAPAAIWEAIGKAGEAEGFQWGGRWKTVDCPHLQYTSLGTSAELDRLQAAYPNGYKP